MTIDDFEPTEFLKKLNSGTIINVVITQRLYKKDNQIIEQNGTAFFNENMVSDYILKKADIIKKMGYDRLEINDDYTAFFMSGENSDDIIKFSVYPINVYGE